MGAPTADDVIAHFTFFERTRECFWRHLSTQLAFDDFEVKTCYRGCRSYSIKLVGPLRKVDDIDLLEAESLIL